MLSFFFPLSGEELCSDAIKGDYRGNVLKSRCVHWNAICQCVHVCRIYDCVCFYFVTVFREKYYGVVEGGWKKKLKSVFLFWFSAHLFTTKMQKKKEKMTSCINRSINVCLWKVLFPISFFFPPSMACCPSSANLGACVCVYLYAWLLLPHAALASIVRARRVGGLGGWMCVCVAGRWMCHVQVLLLGPPPPSRLYKDPGALSICLKKQVWRNLSKNKTTVWPVI